MEDSKGNPPKRGCTVPVLIVIILVLFGWYIVSDRVTPYTSNASVQGFVIAVVPDVSGYVSEISVKKNSLVEAGATLVQIETARFENAVEAAEAELETAGQAVGSSTASVATATAAVASARAQLEEVKSQATFDQRESVHGTGECKRAFAALTLAPTSLPVTWEAFALAVDILRCAASCILGEHSELGFIQHSRFNASNCYDLCECLQCESCAASLARGVKGRSGPVADLVTLGGKVRSTDKLM